jgi:hypothetical protein
VVNAAFADAHDPRYRVSLRELQRTVQTDCLNDVVKEINDTLTEAKAQLDALAEQVGLSPFIGVDWQNTKLDIDETWATVTKAVLGTLELGVAAFLSLYVYGVSNFMLMLVSMAGEITAMAVAVPFLAFALLPAPTGKDLLAILDRVIRRVASRLA